MADDLVLDASVAAKCFFSEAGSIEARELVYSGARFIAPDLIYAEMASIAAKYVRRGLIPQSLGAEAVAGLSEILEEAIPLSTLAPRAFALATAHGLSAYDGCYLALAESHHKQVITADAKLIARARDGGLSSLVRALN